MRRSHVDPFAGAAGLATVGDWLRFAEKLYARERLALGQVATNAHDEALYLLLRTLERPLDSDAEVLEKKLTATERARVEAVFRRRALERVPAAYLTREAWLGEHRFYVDERVIIPRSYFLEIIPQQLETWLPRGVKVRRVADVCTGSGCLAILLARHFRSAAVDACDLSADALEVAKINVHEHRLENRIHLYRSDVFDSVPPTVAGATGPSPRTRSRGKVSAPGTPRLRQSEGVRYDVIISNPPYEPSAHVDQQAPEFAAEPRMAHDGGRDGLVIIRKLLRQARERLQPHGIVVIEVGGLRRAIDREFASLQPQWLPTTDGTNCVALFKAARLEAWRESA